MNKCALCGNDSDVNTIEPGSTNTFCKQCGGFQTYYWTPIEDNIRHIIAGYLFDKNNREAEKPLDLNAGKIKSILSDPIIPKTFYEKLQRILIHYYKLNDQYRQEFIIDSSTDYTYSYAKNRNEFKDMIYLLSHEGFFDTNYQEIGNVNKPDEDKIIRFSITLEGINEAERLLGDVNYNNQVFVAMGFYDDLLSAFDNAIKPACEECNKLNAVLIKDVAFNGDINDRIIAEIKASKFVITDFTYNNQGAYFEAGFAQGYGLEVIRTCKKSWFHEKDEHGHKKNKLHFDVEHYNFILWDSEEDLKTQLVDRIRARLM